MQSALRGSRLTALEREVVGLTVSRFNDCAYSLAAHSRVRRRRRRLDGADRRAAGRRAARRRAAGAPARVHRRPCSTERGHVAPATSTPRTTLEVLAQIAYTTLANYAADVSGAPIDDAFRALV